MPNEEHRTKNNVEVDYGTFRYGLSLVFLFFLLLLSDFSPISFNTEGPNPSSASLTPIYRKLGHLVVLQLAQVSCFFTLK